MSDITLFGAHLSPFVRKVRLALTHKAIDFEHVFVVPFGDDQPPEFKANSPLGKIPLLRAGEHYIPDSSVICAWLERERPEMPLLPSNSFDAARALWFEEYADSVMTTAMGGHLFAEVVLAPAVLGRESNQADIDQAIHIEIPAIFDYLESELQGNYLVGDTLTLADLSVGSITVNMRHAGHECDAGRWPQTAAYLDSLHNSELFAPIIAEEKQMLASFG